MDEEILAFGRPSLVDNIKAMRRFCEGAPPQMCSLRSPECLNSKTSQMASTLALSGS